VKRIYKAAKGDKVWWVDYPNVIGKFVFTLDKKKFFNLFGDYPQKLSVEEWIAFNEDNPYWEKFFAEENRDYIIDHIKELEVLGKLDVVKRAWDSV